MLDLSTVKTVYSRTELTNVPGGDVSSSDKKLSWCSLNEFLEQEKLLNKVVLSTLLLCTYQIGLLFCVCVRVRACLYCC